MSNSTQKTTILFLAANPQDTTRLRLEQELNEIDAGLLRSQRRDYFRLEKRSAVTARELQRAMLDYKPQIVHFSGHGEKEKGLVLEDLTGKAQYVPTDGLAKLFEFCGKKWKINCVVLNACYSEEQADAIAQHVPYVIGMSRDIGDAVAREFSVGFYDALGAGESIESAYENGCISIRLYQITEDLIPVLRQQPKAASQPVSEINQANSERHESPELAEPENVGAMGKAQVFISYRSEDSDLLLAREFHDAIQNAGYGVFMAGESIRLGEDWVQRIDAELARCDYFLLLLSERSAVSEMVTEEVRRAKQLRDQTGKPMLLPIRVNFPISSQLNYDLRGYLQRIQQREWYNAADTAVILAEVMDLLGSNQAPSARAVLEEPIDPPSIAEALAQKESVQMPPLPVAEPGLPGGQVDLASRFYVERGNIETLCYEAITIPGALIRIKAPRQMGKTSLMSRILRCAEQQGCLGVPLSFQIADAAVFDDLDKFLRWFAASVGRRLRMPNRLNDYWDDVFGSKDNCTAYFEEYLLRELKQPLALCLDEVDMVFQHLPIASDFFGLLRNWHEMGKTSELWKQFRLVVVHSTEVYIPMNINQSPFNVGLPIELPEFTAEQVQDLAERHGLKWNTSQIGRLMGMVGGHPYLVRLALYHIARGGSTLDALLREAATESGLYGDHLRRHLWNLEQHPELADAVRQLVGTDGAIRLPSVQAFQLHSMGLVDLRGNDVGFRSELYRTYFADRLGERS